MKLTINMLRNVCVLFLTLRDRAQAEGMTQAAANADKAYRNYRELLNQAQEKRPSGVGAGQPSLSWKITIKTRLPLFGGVGNGTDVCSEESEAGQLPKSAQAIVCRPSGSNSLEPESITCN